MQLSKHTMAVARCASTDETRPNLCGVLMAGTRAVATDGHRLAILDEMPIPADMVPAELAETDAKDVVLLNAKAVEKACKSIKGKSRFLHDGRAFVASGNGTRAISVPIAGTVVNAENIAEGFPDYEYVAHDTHATPPVLEIGVNPHYLRDVAQSFIDAGFGSMILTLHDDVTAIVASQSDGGRTLTVYLMPMRA